MTISRTDPLPPVAAQLFPVALPPVVEVSGYLRYQYWSSSGACGETPLGNVLNQDWTLGAGGESIFFERDPVHGNRTTIEQWPSDHLPVSTWESLYRLDGSTQLFYADECTYMGGYYWMRYYEGDRIQTALRLSAGGPAQKQVQQLIRLTLSVLDAGGLPVPPSQVQILGECLMPTATNSDVGEMYLTMPYGAARGFTPTVIGVASCTFDNVHAEAINLQIAANGTPLATDATNAEFCVGQKVTFTTNWSQMPAGVQTEKSQWVLSPGYVNCVIVRDWPQESDIYANLSEFLTNSSTAASVGNRWIRAAGKLQGRIAREPHLQ